MAVIPVCLSYVIVNKQMDFVEEKTKYFMTSLCYLHPPSILFDFRYSYMIDNVILLITGTLHQRAISELVPKCHPLGSFEQMEAVNIAQTPAELYNAILVDTPLGMYTFLNHLNQEE